MENEAQGTAIYLCRTLGGHKLSVIAEAMGLKNYSTKSSACLAIKARTEKEATATL